MPGAGKGRPGEGQPVGAGLPLGQREHFGLRQRWCLPNTVKALNATELVTLQWLILSYVTLILIFFLKTVGKAYKLGVMLAKV